MHQEHDAFLEFRKTLKALAHAAAPDQLHALKYILLRALFRGSDFRERGDALQQQLDRVRAERTSRAWEYEKHTTNLRRLLEERSAELAVAKGDVASLQARCRAMEDLCRSLVRTIESATCEEEEVPETLPSVTKPLGFPQ